MRERLKGLRRHADQPNGDGVDPGERKTMVAIGITLLAAIGAWSLVPTAQQREDAAVERQLEDGGVAKVAQAPDGATVWAVRRNGRTLYFSKGSVTLAPIDGGPSA